MDEAFERLLRDHRWHGTGERWIQVRCAKDGAKMFQFKRVIGANEAAEQFATIEEARAYGLGFAARDAFDVEEAVDGQ